MKVDGACHCGAIRYEAEVDPRGVILCHCTDCQVISGAPYRANVRAEASKVRLSGEPRTYAKIGGSGDTVTTAFCAVCGTALYSCKGETPEHLWLRLGAIGQRAELAPAAQGFCDSALPWSMDITGVRRIAAS